MKKQLLLLIFFCSAFFANAENLKWIDASSLTLYGKITENTFERYGRLPESFKGTHLWELGQHSSGLYVKFKTDASAVTLRWTPLYHSRLDNVIGIASTGLDLYVLTDKWEFCGAGRVSSEEQSTTRIACEYLPSGENEFMLYLPTYDGIKKLEIGVPDDAFFSDSSLDSPRSDKAVIVYGTSIVQGASPSRAGLAGTNVMSRMLDRMVINLGFSGNAHLDPEIAQLMAAYPHPEAFVIDNVANCTDSLIYARQEQFFHIIRNAHPQVPVIFVEACYHYRGQFDKEHQLRIKSADIAFRNVYQKLLGAGQKNIYFIEGDPQLDYDLDNTPDGSHYNDVAFREYSKLVCGVISKFVEDKPSDGHSIELEPRSVLELRHGEGNSRNSEGDFIRLNDGRILFAYSKFVGGEGGDHDACVISSLVSSDEGETWSKEDRVIAENTLEAGGNVMSVSLLRLDQKRIALFYLRKIKGDKEDKATQIIMKVSKDDGKTWGKEADITRDFPLSYRVVNNSRIIRLGSGRVLVPVAQHSIDVSNSSLVNDVLYCLYSDDNCKTWKKSGELRIRDYDGSAVVTQEPGVIELENDSVLMYTRSYSGCQWYAYSSDGGLTWGGTRRSMLKSPVSPAKLLRLENGEILGIWNNHSARADYAAALDGFGVRTPLTIGLSFDEGETWKFVRDIENGFDKNDLGHYWYCYPAALELEDSILLSYCAENVLRDSRIVKIPKALLKQRP